MPGRCLHYFEGKTNKSGKKQFMGFLRHKDPLLCSQGAMAQPHPPTMCQLIKEENLCEHGKTSRLVLAEAAYCPDAVAKGNYINNTLQRCGHLGRGTERSTIVKEAYCDSWACKQKAFARRRYKCCQCKRVNPRVSNMASIPPICECEERPMCELHTGVARIVRFFHLSNRIIKKTTKHGFC